MVFGHELLLDCYDCKPGTCSDLDHCYHFLDNLVDYIGMKKQSPPSIFHTDRKLYPDKAGLSGWVPLVESSIVIHTLTHTNFISVDLYTCGKLDKKKAIAFVKKFFKPKRIEAQYLERGLHYFEGK